MLDRLLMAMVERRPELLRSVLQGELERLREGGYLNPEDVEQLSARAMERLGEHVSQVQGAVAPLADGVAGALRSMLDVPSREEVEELLRQAGHAGDAPGGE